MKVVVFICFEIYFSLTNDDIQERKNEKESVREREKVKDTQCKFVMFFS